MRLRDKVAVVTGAGRGIGQAIAERYAREGASVVVADVIAGNATRVVEGIRAAGGKAEAVTVDVTKLGSVEAMIVEAVRASKAGVTMLTKVMAVELAPYGINVNEIAPGPVNTEMTAVTHDEATRRAYYNLIPMKRYAERDEVAAAAVFLASAEAAFINGHTLNVDGGFQAAGLTFER